MSRADGIIKRVDAALNKVAPPVRSVYIRQVTRTGGDDLIGRGQTVSTTDTLMSPQPFYMRLGRQVVGDNVPAQELIGTNQLNSIADDYAIIFSPNSITATQLEDPDFCMVFKDTTGLEEVFRVTDFEPIGMSGQTVIYAAYIRSITRPS